MKKRHYKPLYYLLCVFVFCYLLFKVVSVYSDSLFVQKGDRINFLIYGNQTAFYSLDVKDTRHYVMYFYPDLKMQIPGGYGDYRTGSLGKLALLDKNPEILTKTFSVATTSFVNLYFYPASEDVYYGTEIQKKPSAPSIKTILFMSGNAGFFDRLYLALWLLDKKNDDFKQIAYQSETNKIHNDVFFEDKSFIKNSIGLLFQKQYRDEQKNIQLQYAKNYNVADKVSTLLEGNGIRVNDITLDMKRSTTCSIVEDTNEHSRTAVDIANFFHCTLTKGKTDVYDIIFVLGTVEKNWEV
ncbi:hypothetical protein BH09PAT2_BH09PAT2_08400 [soil metagenome]